MVTYYFLLCGDTYTCAEWVLKALPNQNDYVSQHFYRYEEIPKVSVNGETSCLSRTTRNVGWYNLQCWKL